MAEWISVKDMLPEQDVDCICRYGFHKGPKDSGMRFTGTLMYFAHDTNPHWQHEGTGLFVTHWMPIPDPPAEET